MMNGTAYKVKKKVFECLISLQILLLPQFQEDFKENNNVF